MCLFMEHLLCAGTALGPGDAIISRIDRSLLSNPFRGVKTSTYLVLTLHRTHTVTRGRGGY